MSQSLSNAQLTGKLERQMQRALERIMHVIRIKEGEFLESSARAAISESDSETNSERTFLHQLSHFEDPLLHMQMHFWKCMFDAAMVHAIKFPADPHCDLEAWFNEIIIPSITKDFGCSCREEQAQLLTRLGVECLESLQQLLPLNLVTSALMLERSELPASLHSKVMKRVIARDRVLANS